jgi:hypothetical protein
MVTKWSTIGLGIVNSVMAGSLTLNVLMLIPEDAIARAVVTLTPTMVLATLFYSAMAPLLVCPLLPRAILASCDTTRLRCAGFLLSMLAIEFAIYCFVFALFRMTRGIDVDRDILLAEPLIALFVFFSRICYSGRCLLFPLR